MDESGKGMDVNMAGMWVADGVMLRWSVGGVRRYNILLYVHYLATFTRGRYSLIVYCFSARRCG